MSIWDKLNTMVQFWVAPLTQWFLRLFRQICNHTSKVITTHWKMTGALVLKSFACWSIATALRRLVFHKFGHVSSVLQDLNNIKIIRLLMRCYLPLINALRQASQSHWRCSHLKRPAWNLNRGDSHGCDFVIHPVWEDGSCQHLCQRRFGRIFSDILRKG